MIAAKQIAQQALATVLMYLVAPQFAYCADFPSQTIKIVVPFAAGSGTDAIARITAQALGDYLKAAVIVENKAGANGTIAAEFVAKAAPDGYTLFMTTNTTHSANPSLMKRIPYDPIKSFTPVSRMGNLPFMLVVNTALPIKSVADLIAYGKANPGKLTYATGNSTGIVGGATLANLSGIEMLHVPYKSTPPAMIDVISGQVSFMFVDTAAGLSNVTAGKLRAIAISTDERSKLFPDLPPVAATQGLKTFNITSWNGVFAPAGTPTDVIEKLNKGLVAVVKDKAIQEKFSGLGFDGFSSTPEQLGVFVATQLVQWTKMIKNAGIVAE